MSGLVLITYATRYGSTKEVAEYIYKLLKDKGFEVDIILCKDVKQIDQYQFIILGTPYYIGKMLKDAKNFLVDNQDLLSRKAIAVFALGPIGEVEKEKTDARLQMDNELKQFTWLQPVATEMFGGKYDPEKLRFLDKLLTKPPASPLHDLQANDSRNWEVIKRWSEIVVNQLNKIV